MDQSTSIFERIDKLSPRQGGTPAAMKGLTVRHLKLTLTALVMRNSLSYLENVFALNAARRTLVTVPDASFTDGLFELEIESCIVPDDGGGWFVANHALSHDEQPAQISYTSGTEGAPKAIVLTHSNLADAAERIIAEMKLTSEVREYVGVPVTYSFGMGRIRAISASGGRSYLPARGFDPLELAQMLESGEVNSLSAVPTLLRVLLQTPGRIRRVGGKLRWLEIGSQYMTGAEKRAVCELFPNARIVQHYGLTEASRSTFLQISEASGDVLESVGAAVGSTELGISERGRIRIRGQHVARWRIGCDQLVELCDADGWLETNDIGHIENGYLYYDGRADDLINSGGVKINPYMLEARIGQLLGHGASVVVAKVPDALRGDGILVVTESSDVGLERLRTVSGQAMEELNVYTGNALHVLVTSTMPKTATGKPLRRLLTEEFIRTQAVAATHPVADQASNADANDVRAFFRQSFPGQRIGEKDSFQSMGGDSLSYIQFSLGLEDRLGPLPSDWDSLTVAQLESRASTKDIGMWRQLPSATITRAFFMVCIVALHFDTFIYSSNWGAAYFLFMLCGYSVMRFQWPEISRTGKVDTIFNTIARVAIPTVLVIIAMQLWAKEFELKPLLLISNLFDPAKYRIAYYYFAEIYIQLLLIIAALLSFARVRQWLRDKPMISCTAFVAVSMVVSWIVNQTWDTTYIYHRTPIWYCWTAASGMLIASARDLRSRFFALAIVTLAVLAHHGFTSASAYILGGASLLLFWPSIPVPSLIKRVVSEIAGSSMFLYLSHTQVRSLVIRVFHGPMPRVALILAIIVGILFAHIYHWLDRQALAFAKQNRLVASVSRSIQRRWGVRDAAHSRS